VFLTDGLSDGTKLYETCQDQKHEILHKQNKIAEDVTYYETKCNRK